MWLANEALRRVKGADVALIAASEPLWAALAGIAFLGDALWAQESVDRAGAGRVPGRVPGRVGVPEIQQSGGRVFSVFFFFGFDMGLFG